MADAATELEALAFRLRRLGDGGLVRELTEAMRRAAGQVPDEIRAGLVPESPKLPNRYAAELDADVRIGVNVRTTGSDPGVSVTGTTRSGRARKLRRLDAGRLTHPVYGNREVWRTQEEPSVQPGWFTGPARDAEPRVRAEIEQVLRDIEAKEMRAP